MSSSTSLSVGGLLSRVGLGLLTLLVPAELGDEVLVWTERVEQRRRGLPSRLGVYFVLALCLLRVQSYGSVLRSVLPVGAAGRDGGRVAGAGLVCALDNGVE